MTIEHSNKEAEISVLSDAIDIDLGNEKENSHVSSSNTVSDKSEKTISNDLSETKSDAGIETEQQKPNNVSVDKDNVFEQKRPNTTSVDKDDVFEDAKETTSATVVVPPDGGWGWVVVAASFVCNFIVDGIIFSFGLFLADLSDGFNVSRPKVAIIGSLLSGFYLMVGPFVSALANKFGFKSVTIVGSLISAVAFMLSSLATDVEYLYVMYGIIGGIGYGMIYSPSIITVGFYFERWRALATGIAVCGSGIGTFLLAPLCQVFIKTYGWRGAFIAQGLLTAVCVFCGLLFRPLKPIRVTVEKDSGKLPELKAPENLLHRIKQARDEDLRRSASTKSLKDLESGSKVGKNSEYPTAAELLIPDREELSIVSTIAKSSQSLNNQIIGNSLDKEKRYSAPIFFNKLDAGSLKQNSDASITIVSNGKCVGKESKSCCESPSQRKRIRTTSECSSVVSKSRSRRGTVTEYLIHSRRGTITKLDEGINRPLYRDDIFFTSSLHRLPQYPPETDFLGYTMSVTHLPTKSDERDKGCQLCSEAVRRAMATMLDVSLLKSPTFMLLSASGFLTLMGFYTPFMFLTDRAIQNGLGEDAVWLISAIGVTNTVGRVLCGLLSSLPSVNALVVNNIALTVGGLATMCSGLLTESWFLFSYCAVFGFSIACFASLRSILLVDLLGLDKLTNAFGLLLLFQGIAAAIGSPIAGSFYDLTGNYDASFYLSGALILVSGILCYPLNAINRWEKRRSQQRKDEESCK